MKSILSRFIVFGTLSVLVMTGCSSNLIKDNGSCIMKCTNTFGVVKATQSKPENMEGVAFRIILVGDAGDISEGDPKRDSIILKQQLSDWVLRSTNTRIVYLGDNIYDFGLREKDHDKGVKILQQQLNAGYQSAISGKRGVENIPKIFVPGNHDWSRDGKDGPEIVKRQQKYVDEYQDEQGQKIAKFIPKNACPGPHAIDLMTNSSGNKNFRDISILAIDTQWWLDRHRGKRTVATCNISEKQFLSNLEKKLEERKDKHVIVVAHHPIMSTGEHGGYRTPWYNGILSLFRPANQDIHKPRYENMIHKFNRVFNKTKPLLYAAGHDHSLQIMRPHNSAKFAIVSGAGSGSKVGHVTSDPYTIYAQAREKQSGFMVLDIVREQGVEKIILRVVLDGKSEPDFSLELFPANDMFSPWPAESVGNAEALFSESSADIGHGRNWSGAYWNEITNKLWLVNNRSSIRSYLLEKGPDSKKEQFVIHNEFSIKGDWEGITQTHNDPDHIFVLAEKARSIKQYEITGSKPELINSWSFAHVLKKGESMEGLAFVPNSFLATQMFTDSSGNLVSTSSSALQGLFFISNQNNGGLYALDLVGGRKQASLIGRYKLPTQETRGLEFDERNGQLHFIDGTQWGVTHLSSSKISVGEVKPDDFLKEYPWRKMNVIRFGIGPGPEGIEGLAVINRQDEERWAVVVDDENSTFRIDKKPYNSDRNRAVLLYKQYSP